MIELPLLQLLQSINIIFNQLMNLDLLQSQFFFRFNQKATDLMQQQFLTFKSILKKKIENHIILKQKNIALTTSKDKILQQQKDKILIQSKEHVNEYFPIKSNRSINSSKRSNKNNELDDIQCKEFVLSKVPQSFWSKVDNDKKMCKFKYVISNKLTFVKNPYIADSLQKPIQ